MRRGGKTRLLHRGKDSGKRAWKSSGLRGARRKKDVTGAVEEYLERCADIKVDMEAWDRLMEPEEAEVCLRYILKYATGRGSNIFHLFDTRFVASKRRWLEHQGERVDLQESWQNEWHDIKYQGIVAKDPLCPERTLKTPLPQQSSSSSRDEEGQWISVEDRCRWRCRVRPREC